MQDPRSNQEWIDELSSEDTRREAALSDLRGLLLRAALFFFNRNPGDLAGLDQREIQQRAEDCAQDALVAVTSHLGDFRGDSKFTTWAYKFAINMALMAARRERWKGVSLDQFESDDPGMFLDDMTEDRSPAQAPEQSALREELRAAILEIIETELTDRQRRVMVLMVFREVPMDEVVRHLDTNRNAIYKLLHDARLKIKQGLQERGFEINEALTLFGSPG